MQRTTDTERPDLVQGSPVKRENNYDFVTASPPTQTNSESIHDDGTDFSYFAGIDFGSRGKTMYMLVDTGAANTWVMSSECNTQVCAEHNTFGSSDSTSIEVSSDEFGLTYGTGSVSGVTAKDTVEIAGVSVSLPFGLASKVSDDFSTYPMDGILGLGFPASKAMDFPTAMETIQKARALTSNVFGVNLQRSSDGSTDGELSFGAPDITKFQGDLSYTNLVDGASMWEIPVDDTNVNGSPCRFAGRTAIIDTGTSFMLLPPADAKQLHSQIPSSQANGETYSIPCASNASLQLIFSGISYNISPADYVGSPTNDGSSICTSNIVGRRPFGEDQWLVGDVFLKNVYSVFDYDEARIGFAAKASQSSSTSAQVSHPATTLNAGTSSYRIPRSSETTSVAGNPTLVADTALSSVSAKAQEVRPIAACCLNHAMSEDSYSDADAEDPSVEEASSLLPNGGSDTQPTTSKKRAHALKRPSPGRRESSLSQVTHDGPPRTPRKMNRVRFELEEQNMTEHEQNGRMARPVWRADEEDNVSYDTLVNGRSSISQRAPLLTGIEAPSVTVATTDLDFNAEDLLESSRPKSGMRSAFMNMANSIMYVTKYRNQGTAWSAPATNDSVVVLV
ncbi:MAG: hypothetical protein Q9170_004126 [Blastenia crenularia]